MPEKKEPVSKLELIKSLSNILIWIVGLIFAAGIAYSKVTEIDETSKDQTVKISEMKDAQVRTAEAIERMEETSKDFNVRVFAELEKTNEKMSSMEERIIRNEVNIDRNAEAIKKGL